MGSDIFARCFARTVGEEGGYTADPNDAGNWTGGEIGKGTCRGTKFGISAAAYPTLDIAALTLEQARAIYLRDYWTPIRADDLPPPLAMLLFDAAVNNGVETAVRRLQQVLKVTVDGILGPLTLSALPRGNLKTTCAKFQVLRWGALPRDLRYADGWDIRLMRITLDAGGLLSE